jgi:aminoglycoside phosphotransferase (APT) family kinase protein
MEPALPPLHPKLPWLLDHLKLKPVDAVKWNVLVCQRTDAPEGDDQAAQEQLVLKYGEDSRKQKSMSYEVKLLRGILPDIDQAEFERLVLPEYVDDGVFQGLQWVLTKYIKGKMLVYDWSELSFKSDYLGGKAIGLEVAEYAVDVLRDLRTVDAEGLPEYVRRFKFEDWRNMFAERSQELIERQQLTAETVAEAKKLFDQLPAYRYDGNMFTNGDFYPRNFIMLNQGQIAVADWVGGVDPWTFVAMHAWLMMWNNPEWQASYIKGLTKHFPIDIEEMQAALLVRSFDNIYRWRKDSEESIGLARSQMVSYFHQSLSADYVRELFVV